MQGDYSGACAKLEKIAGTNTQGSGDNENGSWKDKLVKKFRDSARSGVGKHSLNDEELSWRLKRASWKVHLAAVLRLGVCHCVALSLVIKWLAHRVRRAQLTLQAKNYKKP